VKVVRLNTTKDCRLLTERVARAPTVEARSGSTIRVLARRWRRAHNPAPRHRPRHGALSQFIGIDHPNQVRPVQQLVGQTRRHRGRHADGRIDPRPIVANKITQLEF
jgi:hypothetical protein